MRTVQYIPLATEKAYAIQPQNTYMFYVPMKASKQEIAKQISAAFSVTVTDVRTVIRKGKPARVSRGKHAYPGTTNRQDRKVAYITVKEGDKIPVFEDGKAEKKEEKSEAKPKKEAKKAEVKNKEEK